MQSRVAFLAGLLLLASGTPACLAQEAEPQDVQQNQIALVRVHLPITGSGDQVLEATISRVRDRLLDEARRARNPRRPTLVLQLEPNRQAGVGGAGSQFERVLSLARFLGSRQMADVKTVAFLPRSISGHGALLAIACEEIVMAADATLGEAGIDEQREGSLTQTVVEAYREIADARRTMPVALAVGMINPAAEVLQLETEAGTEFVLREDLVDADQQREVIDEKTLVPAGSLAVFSGREGRQFGFVKFLAGDRAGLARALSVTVEEIQEDEVLAGQWQPTLVELQGTITPRVVNRVETMVTSAVEQGANWIGLRIDSSGGDLAASIQLATTLAKLDPNSVRTVAYIPAEATGGAALVAMACDQVVMHPEARLGTTVPPPVAADQPGLPLPQQQDDAELDAARTSIRQSLAPRTERNWSLLAAMVDPRLELLAYRNRTTGETRWMSIEEVQTLDDADDWQRGEPLGPAGELLSLDGTRAEQQGLASATVNSFDELKQLYRFEEDPVLAKPNWALELIGALASPEFSVVLLLIGFAGIYLELKTPGIGVGAFVGSVAIMLFFWSQYLNGTAGWLEVLLFVAGLCFVLMEIFVLPGFGIFGLGGGAMMIASLVLASLTFFLPHSQQDLDELARAVGIVAVAGAGMILCVLAGRRFLPEAPLFRRIVLAPPEPDRQAELEERESLADFSHLIGAHGVAKTDLRPAGKAEIDHQLIDVIAETEPLDRGTPIEVVDAHANRVVVRATGPA